jgi:dTMP kinase
LTVLIDTPLEVANERRAPDVRDRFESADLDFHQRVRDGYLVIAARWGERWCVIDGSRSEDRRRRVGRRATRLFTMVR